MPWFNHNQYNNICSVYVLSQQLSSGSEAIAGLLTVESVDIRGMYMLIRCDFIPGYDLTLLTMVETNCDWS